MNFVQTQKKKKKKKELHNQLDEFYRRIKLTDLFKNTRKEADLFDKEYRFKSKNKDWVPTRIHHTVDTFMEVSKKTLMNS